MYVSPFNSVLNQKYNVISRYSDDNIFCSIQLIENDKTIMKVSFDLYKTNFSKIRLQRSIIIVLQIGLESFKLYLKKIKIYKKN
jgi:DUF1365 family protein